MPETEASALSSSALREIRKLHFLLDSLLDLPELFPPRSTYASCNSCLVLKIGFRLKLKSVHTHRLLNLPSPQYSNLTSKDFQSFVHFRPSISSSVTTWYSERLLQSFVHKYTTLAPQQLSPNTTKLAGLHYLAYTFIRPLLGPKFRVFVGGDLKPP